ncbi:hypothetical protein CR513_17818, partial [Mucuna pruriens]
MQLDLRRIYANHEECITTICILAYGSPTNNMDDYIFVSNVSTIFRDEYLKRLSNQDIEQPL